MIYSNHQSVLIGKMDQSCLHCHALKFQNETPTMCCENGKVSLQPLNEPPEPLRSYVSGSSPLSKHFLTNIRKIKSAFQMTSFGATKVVKENGYSTTFKIQGQAYHLHGSLLPATDGDDSKFLQIYFMGDREMETNTRCTISNGLNREIISNLQTLYHQHNHLVRLFKIALDRMPSNDYQIVIRADKTPSGEHRGRFNAPTINEVAIVMVGQEFSKRDIVLQKRDCTLKRVSETHRSYDALQYPVLFWDGQDGYHIQILQTNTSEEKKVSYNEIIIVL